jgi:uncharacterized membrane protein
MVVTIDPEWLRPFRGWDILPKIRSMPIVLRANGQRVAGTRFDEALQTIREGEGDAEP